MPRAATAPEMAVRRLLHKRGLRFTTNRRDLPGSPDIVLSRARVAVFIDGCFWHRCPEHGVVPKNNREWWIAKFDGTAERDKRKDLALGELGWTALHFWEHELAADVTCAIELLWRERTGRA
jgi:DNA mismatch endonuclease (patch repair protein)